MNLPQADLLADNSRESPAVVRQFSRFKIHAAKRRIFIMPIRCFSRLLQDIHDEAEILAQPSASFTLPIREVAAPRPATNGK
jgi:hypothetical protein